MISERGETGNQDDTVRLVEIPLAFVPLGLRPNNLIIVFLIRLADSLAEFGKTCGDQFRV